MKQHCSLISLTTSKSAVELKAYPRMASSFTRYFVTWRPAKLSLPLSTACYYTCPSMTGITWVTPSPESSTSPDECPSAISESKAYVSNKHAPKLNFSKITSAILSLFFRGCTAASVTIIPLSFIFDGSIPILVWKVYPQSFSKSSQSRT